MRTGEFITAVIIFGLSGFLMVLGITHFMEKGFLMNNAFLYASKKWIKRMKRMLPGWSFIGADDNSIGAVGALERADYIYVYTDALKHAQYYRAMNIVKSKGKGLYYLGSSNIDECLSQFGIELNR